MQAYTELLPPSAVTHAVSLSFTSPSSRNLVVAKTSLLQIFKVLTLPHEISDAQANGTRRDSDANGSSGASRWQLALVGEYPIAGTVTSLAAIKALGTKSGGEALLIASRDAKISLVEWDPEAHSLSTLSIHYYEGEHLQGSPWTPELSHWPCYLTVDPSNRCAALKFGQRHIAILPFRQVGDDLVMADEDPDLDEPDGQPKQDQQLNGNSDSHQTPYSASFVLPLTALDPSIIHPIDLAFLYEYREPTLGVLSCSIGGAASMLRKDVMTYTAFTLDLEQKARTPLLSVSGLPSDLFRLVPLPLPVGGALLIGANELIHVDQAGKTHGIGVNDFSKQSSSFSMTDQSELDLRLEGCVVAPLNTGSGDMILSLIDGTLAILTFRMDGRSVSGLSVTPVPADRGGNTLGASASCAVALGHGTIFIGSDEADAIVLSCSSPDGQLPRKQSHAGMPGEEEDDVSDEDVEDDDDLYGNDSSPAKQAAAGTLTTVNLDDVNFIVQDRLINIALASEAAIGRTLITFPKAATETQPADQLDVHLAVPTGRGKAGSLAILNHSVRLTVQRDLGLNDVKRVWSVRLRPAAAKKGDIVPMPEHDSLLVTAHVDADGLETSAIYTINETGIQQRTDSDFEADASTIDIGVMQHGSRLIQVSKAELRSYDPALDFPQIVPMSDEETDAELKITHTSFADPYALVLRDDSSVCILHMDTKGELEELDKPEAFTSIKWSSGALYHAQETNETFAFLLSVEDSVHVFCLPNLSEPVVTYDGFPHLPPYIHRDYARRRMAARVNFRELLVTTFGDAQSNPLHLIFRTSNDDVVCYQAYQYPTSSGSSPLTRNTRWRKVLNTYATIDPDDDDEVATSDALRARMKTVTLEDGHEAVVVPGATPKWIVKKSSALPAAIDIAGNDTLDIHSYHAPQSLQGFAVVHPSGQVSIARLPQGIQFTPGGWTARRMPIGHDVDAVAFHPPSGLYAIGTNRPTAFQLVEDDWHPEWAKEAETTFKPHVTHGTVSLIHPDTASIIDSIELLPHETLLCLSVLSLEVSEYTNERKLLVAAGTAVIEGEDSACNGGIYVFEVVPVVPEPDQPETNFKLRQIVREDVRGAVSAISEIGNQGFLLHAQGQKCMVRGLKEDDSLLPVAFMDMQCYVSVIKGLKGTGLALMGDAVKGLWLAGYSPEPYRMQLFGKSRPRFDVLAADFLPDNKQLFMAVADAACDLHILEFNPEDPKSLSGQRLLQRSTFHTGHLPVSVDVLPTSYHGAGKSGAAHAANGDGNGDSNSDGDEDMPDAQKVGVTLAPSHQVLVASSSGSIALLTPLPEAVYRRLGALQTHLSNVLEHAAGLNPRAYRAVESEGFGSRGVLDGSLLWRWGELSVQRRQEALARAGTEGWELRADFEVLRGRGLGF